MEIIRPKEFESLRKDRKNYQKVIDEINAIEAFVPKYKDLLLRKMGVKSPYGIGPVPVIKYVNSGSIRLELQAERRIGKTSYKSIVDGWESCMNGINFASDTRTLTGVLKEDGKNYVSCESVLSDFVKIAYGTLNPTVELNIKSAIGAGEENLIYVPEVVKLDNDSAIAYLNAPAYLKGLKELSKAFREDAGEKAEALGTDIVPITKGIGIKSGKIERSGPDYNYVVTTLITMPTKKVKKDASPGELEILADENYGFGNRLGLFDKTYDLIKHAPYGQLKLYAGIDSLIDRIDSLKDEDKKTATVYKAQTVER